MWTDRSPYDIVRFNALASIELADVRVHESGLLTEALASLGPLFVDHGVCDYWGLGLLHRHWDLNVDETPIQRVTSTVAPREYELSPANAYEAGALWPSIVAVDVADGSLFALEFSADPQVGVAYRVLLSRQTFGRRFAKSVAERGWDGLFGLTALRSVTQGLALVEYNYQERISILREVATQETAGKQLMETSWRFHPVSAMGSCESSCFSRCIIPASGGSHEHDHPKAHKPG
jgi:hypothetical protein